jgi:hypothetical protein
MPEAGEELGPQSMRISLESYYAFWRKAKENTSSYPVALSFSTMKAGSLHSDIAKLECLLTSIPLQSGYSLKRWRNCMDVMILKKTGVTTLSSLRTVCLFPVDCNFAFKHIGRSMMHIAELTGSLAPEQYGSRKRRKATDLAVNKALSYDIIRQLKRPAAVCSNDTKSCYDLIGHTPASLAMQRMGFPWSVVDCLFTTLQNAYHYVRTGYGDSSNSYGGPLWQLPIHGIGQGNGAGPAIWAVVSTPLLNVLRQLGFGFSYITPISCTLTNFCGFAFVDDTDLIQLLHSNSSAEEVRFKLQQAIDTWEGLLSSMAGAIVPEKTYWYLIDFCWQGGDWRYRSIAECPGSLTIADISGERKTLKRVEVDIAQETLGIFMAPSGSVEGEILKLQSVIDTWVQKLSFGKLSRQDMWTALNSTIYRMLSYPLPALNLTYQQWESLLKPLLKFALPSLGVCHHYPRSLVFALEGVFGIGLPHLYTCQEIARLKDMILHTTNNTTT